MFFSALIVKEKYKTPVYQKSGVNRLARLD